MGEKKSAVRRPEISAIDLKELTIDVLWDMMYLLEGQSFYTARNLEFTYKIRGNEMFVDRKEKSITKATVKMALDKAKELGGIASGPKKLGTFGASYLYPIFIYLGIIEPEQNRLAFSDET